MKSKWTTFYLRHLRLPNAYGWPSLESTAEVNLKDHTVVALLGLPVSAT